MVMYLGKLSEDQKIAFLRLMQRLIKEDYRLEEKESSAHKSIVKDFGFADNFMVPEAPLEETIKTFDDNKVKAQVLSELFWIGMIDGKLAKEEEYFLKELSDKFGLGDDVFDRIKDLSLQSQSIFEEINALIQSIR